MVHGTSTIETVFQNTKPLEKKHSVKKSLNKMRIFLEAKHMLLPIVQQQNRGYFTLQCHFEFYTFSTMLKDTRIRIH